MELAMVAPVLLLLLLGMTDLVNYYRVQLRMDTAAVQLAQIVSQCERITTPGDTSQFWAHGQSLMGNPANLTGATPSGTIVVSAVAMVGTTAKVRWQSRVGGTAYASRVGTAGNNAVLAGAMVPANQTLFVVEVDSPVRQAFVLSEKLLTSYLGQPTGTAMFLSRVLDPIALQSPPTNTSAKACTA